MGFLAGPIMGHSWELFSRTKIRKKWVIALCYWVYGDVDCEKINWKFLFKLKFNTEFHLWAYLTEIKTTSYSYTLKYLGKFPWWLSGLWTQLVSMRMGARSLASLSELWYKSHIWLRSHVVVAVACLAAAAPIRLLTWELPYA